MYRQSSSNCLHGVDGQVVVGSTDGQMLADDELTGSPYVLLSLSGPLSSDESGTSIRSACHTASIDVIDKAIGLIASGDIIDFECDATAQVLKAK